jgi:hypothetical protein
VRIAASAEEDGGGLHLVLLLNPVLKELLEKHGLYHIVHQGSLIHYV